VEEWVDCEREEDAEAGEDEGREDGGLVEKDEKG